MKGADELFAEALRLEDLGRHDEALASYRRLLQADPAHADAWHNAGLLLARLGRLDEAEQSHRAYLDALPDSARARTDLADVLLALGRYAAAVEVLDPAIQRHPDDAAALVRRGVAGACGRQFEQARADFATALTRSRSAALQFLQRVAPGADPRYLLSPQNIYLSRSYTALGDCDWTDWPGYVQEMRAAASDPRVVLEPAVAFMATHLPLAGAERHSLTRAIAARMESAVPVLPPPAPGNEGRIRVGILSPDFRDHLKAYALLPLFELVDRKRFALYAYSLSPDDGSAIRVRVRSTAENFRDLHALGDREAALFIRNDDIDILLDTSGYMTGGRLPIMLQRPARVQAALPGFAGSLGSERIDYAIVDRIVAPEQQEWTERMVYLPHNFFPYDFREPVRDVPVSRADYGLPDRGFVFCAFHKPEKITPDSFELWSAILRRAPGSVLWFRDLSPAACSNLRDAAMRRGVEPSRLVFSPFEPRQKPGYLAKHRLGDLMLDALYHNAVTTACDALGAGLPMLTIRGDAMAGRAGESMLRAAGLADLVAPDAWSYVDAAVSIANDPAKLRLLKERLAANRASAPLFDTAGRVRELEDAFEQMLQVSAHIRSRL